GFGGGEQAAGDDAQRHDEEQGAKHGTRDLVEFEGVHPALGLYRLSTSPRPPPAGGSHDLATRHSRIAPIRATRISRLRDATFRRLWARARRLPAEPAA